VGVGLALWQKPYFKSYWAPPFLWALAVICMSGDVGSAKNTFGLFKWLLSWIVDLKPAQIGLVNFFIRKTGHVLSYGLMYFLWFRAFRGHAGYGPGGACLWSFGICLFVAALDEGRQWFYPTRGSSIWDVVLDLSGSSLAALITFAVWTPRPRPVAVAGVVRRETN